MISKNVYSILFYPLYHLLTLFTRYSKNVLVFIW